MWYCIRRTTYGKHRAATQWDFSEKKIMYSGHMSLWDKANTYNKNTIAAQAIDSDLIKDAKFLNFPFWKVGRNGADPRRSRRIRYKYQIGIIQNTNTIRDFSNDGGKKRTELQVHPDGGPPGSHGCNNAQTLNEASVIYRVLRWRKPIPYFIENK